MDPSFYLQLLLNGIVIGCIYALIAMGLSLIFGVLEIVNFAHGEFYMLGAMLAYFLTMNLRLGYAPTVLVVTASAVCLGYVLYEALLVSAAFRMIGPRSGGQRRGVAAGPQGARSHAQGLRLRACESFDFRNFIAYYWGDFGSSSYYMLSPQPIDL